MAGRQNREGTSGLLSERLQMIADMVTPGNRLADVGCDHGYLSIALVEAGICPTAIAMDVREGPLAAAGIHIRAHRLENHICTRLSDGLAGCDAGEADTLVCAGMGGRLMERILTTEMEKVRTMRELILQPQSELPRFRVFLRENGFRIADEDVVCEDGKYYFAMKAVNVRGDGPAEATDELRDGQTEESPGPVETGPGKAAESGGRELTGAEKAERTVPEPDGIGFRQKKPYRERMDAGTAEVQCLYDQYGQILLEKKHPVLWQYLLQRETYLRKLESALAAAGTEKAVRRLREVQRELEDIERALAYYRNAEGRIGRQGVHILDCTDIK